jgi:uncharacterized membrane protein
MRRTSTHVIIVLFTLTVSSCGPGILAPGPPPLDFGPGFQWLALIAIGLAAGAWLSRSKWSVFFRTHGNRRSQAGEILRERYAKGEISREEYLGVRNDLDQ